MSAPRKVLFVCMGNICRSPTAEGVLRHKLLEAGLSDLVSVDSAGTHDYHVGERPDGRSTAHASRRGYDLAALKARQVCSADFESFDLVLAMDSGNFRLLEAQCPDEHKAKLRRMTEFCRRHKLSSVPDPYYGGPDGFERVLDILEDACEGVVAFLAQAHGRAGPATSTAAAPGTS